MDKSIIEIKFNSKFNLDFAKNCPVNKVTNQYYVMAYKYWDELDHCFDHNLMFKTKNEAEQKAYKMNAN